MFNSIKLTLYTQEDCYYCRLLKKKLVEWDFDFREVNISHDLCLFLYSQSSIQTISFSIVYSNRSLLAYIKLI